MPAHRRKGRVTSAAEADKSYFYQARVLAARSAASANERIALLRAAIAHAIRSMATKEVTR